MEHEGMVRMFTTLEDTELRGFLEGTTPVFESTVVEFFSNARVLAGTIVSTVCGQNLVVMEDIFSGTFKLPTEGVQNFSGIPTETIAEMRIRFSATTVPLQSSGKKRDLLFEYRLLHDIVAKSLCAKAGSFDKVTCEKFEFMVAISAGISVNNWGRILFQRLLAMVQTPRKQSQGFTVQVSMLMELLVRADLGTTTKLHVKKVLTSKQVQNYLKGNQGTTPTEETASNTTGGTSQQVLGNHGGSGSRLPAGQRKNKNFRETINTIQVQKQAMTFIGCLDDYLAGNSCLAPTSFSRKPALHGLMRSARTDSPRQDGRNKFRRLEAAAAAAALGGGGGGGFREEGGGRPLA
ncbi:hypothetical protein F511_08062 [Dorcoceras hygrometricum]|uniref:Dystroglycan-like n=1 Tax=Dorcoceras hygrometricum TaxID=472368 RepID=A0A2Z7CTM9_9LAMI|nr:hypothetical protein F511_08062 [Dorcoceras hygrometricum]